MAQRLFTSSSLLLRLRSARRFSTLPNPTTPQNDDAVLVSNILLHHHNPFHGITLSPNLLHHTLLRLKHNSKIALALFHYAKSLPSPPLTADVFHILIDIVAKVRQYDVAWQLILEMDHPTAATFLILVRRLISSGLTRQAFRAFDDIETFVQAQPTSEHFIFLLDTLSKYGYIKLATEVFNKRKHEFAADVKLYTVLVYGWCKIGRFNMAERFLKEMIERGIEPNVVTYNVFLDGICRRASLHPDDI